MATINDIQEKEPPTTALERQVQTFTAVMERLTKQNHDLEEQLLQKNVAPNDQREDQEGTNAERKNQERPEGSNNPSRPERQNLSMPSLTDATPPYIVAEMQAMKEQMKVMMNALKGRMSSDLDDLVNRTDLPFTAVVNCFPLPYKFRMPHINSYDGVKDPLDHLETFKTLMYKKSMACLVSIRQREDETLRSYITRFNKEALSIDKADDKILVTAFTNGLRKGKFLFSLYKNDLKTMSEVLHRVTKYMNAEDVLLAREKQPRERERQEEVRRDQGSKKPRTGDRRDERRSKPRGGRFTSFTPLTALIDQVLMQIKDEGTLTFPGKLKGDPSKRSRDKYCRFHRDQGHDTTDCYDLKQQIEALIRQGKLQKFVNKERADPPPQEQHPRWDNEHPRPPIGDIRMIVGGTIARSSKKARKTYLRMVHNVQLTGSVLKIARIESPIIGFSEEDARRLHHPHDDALVGTLQAGNFNIHRVLVDNGNSANILYYPAFQQMRIDREWLVPTNALLVGFRGTRASTSTYHLMIKFSTEYGVGELRGNQVAARECYIAMLEMGDHQKTICIEEQ
nr:uncharacterized protein LOC112032987 [Quercus suber]